MRTDTAQTIRLADYQPSDYLIDRVDLDIRLDATETRIRASLSLRPNPLGVAGAPLILDGDELDLKALALDGHALPAGSFTVTPQKLVIASPPDRPFTLLVVTEIDPSANTKLMGLYRSGGTYCTQCEAEGFRRITYFLDRPDVLSIYTTRLEADRGEAPVLLGNGNPIEAGLVPNSNRHYAVWHDPHPKPSYLFAAVGGNLGHIGRPFTTTSGREVDLAIYVEPGKEDRAWYALDALERSMRWDEEVFGREYDLDVFNIVAVSDFNMGAMENKGLNIFNDKYVLASPETATDSDYANIEAIIAHEYFHNWSGNRVTCRDWFQLCLKEGLTVFRDQEFSSDQRSRAVHRIAEVKTLRARQFAEDAGSLAHPVRPGEYREINNFYTATVYEKGAEIVRMLKTLVGEADFRRGMDLYFERFDGTAATVEDFLSAFEEVTGRDLTHFACWYSQAGTPRVTASGTYDAERRTYRLDLSQETPPTPGQPVKEPLIIPVLLGLVGPEGTLHTRSNQVRDDGLFVLENAAASVVFEDVAAAPVPSLFRGFSAPVKPTLDLANDELLVLLRHDTDPFNRWQAGQTVAMRLLAAMGAGDSAPEDDIVELSESLRVFLQSEAERDPAFAALVISLPGESDIAQEIARDVDPDRVHRTRLLLRERIATHGLTELVRLYESLASTASYSPDAVSKGKRSLRNAALELIAAANPVEGERLCEAQLANATNMTDRVAALAVITMIPGEAREAALTAFGEQFADEPLVLDKWFGLQAMIPEVDTLERVRALMRHPAFSLANPNRTRALVGAFAMGNQVGFHRADGAGYDFLADLVLQVDPHNPQLASRLLTSFGTWRIMEAGRRAHAEAALRRIADQPNLSRDVGDIVQRSLDSTG
ncbi:aminopeptidase N [Microvirga massiliensis]|uniref:aminopeptidase N n=1 Tax=Microvirga massiliensis TaxID=1033741 RepID=UPI00062B866E|nr:aminopeptidase N [Microvirga massiliensis]